MELLAKSDPRLTLKEHIEDCLKIWQCLKACFPQVPFLTASIDFWDVLRLSVIIHDLGKAHAEFNKVLRMLPNEWYGQRHELFSLPFIDGLTVEEKVKNLIRLIVAGHHKDLEYLKKNFIDTVYSSEFTANDEFGDDGLLDYIVEFGKVDVKSVTQLLEVCSNLTLQEYKVRHPNRLISFNVRKPEYTDPNNKNYFTLLLLFGALKHCDHLGSARVTGIENIDNVSYGFLTQKRIQLQKHGLDFYTHQLICGKIIGNAILTAPTGSGKTESALLWVKKQMCHYGQGRIFYVLPFTASINAMYERLSDDQSGFGKQKVGMLHGKLQDYLYEYLDDVQYTSTKRKETISSIKEKFRTIYTPLKIVTPFQLLKNLFGLKGFEQGIFEWAGGYFIFDEIHAYNPDVFAQIKVFLEYVTQYLKGKVFIMTATMPSFLKFELEAAIGSFTSIIASSGLYKNFRRHRVMIKKGLLRDNLSLIKYDLEAGKKVLVVCNTVNEAQNVYVQLVQYTGYGVLLHSAFTGEDRMINEKKLKQAEFDEKHPIRLLVGTQAIEVSLDIDYDIIYTEPAPFDALIQRFGRVNRQRKKSICPVIIFDTADKSDRFIYSTDTVSRTLDVFSEIAGREEGIIKEEELQRYIDRVYSDWNEADKKAFDESYNLLKYATEHQLVPLLHSKQQEDDFYKQFEGIKVLPLQHKDRYETYLSQYDFIGAERLKLSIKKKKFAQLIAEHNNSLYKTSFIFSSEKGKLIEISYWVITKRYDPEIGLIYSEQEVWNSELL